MDNQVGLNVAEEMPQQNQQNPMLIDPIVGTVLKYLSIINLKSCRAVCRRWSILSIIELKKKGKLDLKRNLKRIQDDDWKIENCLFQSISFDSCIMVQYPSIIQHCVGAHLKKVQFKVIDDEYSLKEFQYFLDQCPNVQEIELLFVITEYPFERQDFFHDMDASTLSKVKVIDIICDFGVELWLVGLMEACSSSLHTLKLQLQESRFKKIFQIFADKSGTIEKLQNLEVGGITYLFTMSSIEYLMDVPWQLSSLRIYVQNNVPPELMRNFLDRLSDTLTELQLSWFCWNENEWGNCTRQSLIPLSLRKLEKLEVNTNDNNVRAFFASENLNLIPTLVSAIQLPRLQCLRLNGTSTLGSFQKFTFAHDTADKLLTAQSQSLQTMTIVGNFKDYSCFMRPIIPWPNVIELNLSIQTPEPELIVSIFATMHQIEKLTLYFKDCREFPWEMILIGEAELVTRRVCGNNGLKNVTPHKNCPLNRENSIVNLQDLTSLKIEGCRLSDAFIYNGLIHLRNLQYVYMPEAKFTKKAVAALRAELRPFANLNFCDKSENICKLFFGQ